MFYCSSGLLKQIGERSSLFDAASCLSQSNNNNNNNNEPVRIKYSSRVSPFIVSVSHIHAAKNCISLTLDDGADSISNAGLDVSQWGRLDPSLLIKLDERFQTSITPSFKNLKIGSVILIHEYEIKQLKQADQFFNIVDFTIIGEKREVSDTSSSSSSSSSSSGSAVCNADKSTASLSQSLNIIADDKSELGHTKESDLMSDNVGAADQEDKTKLQLDPDGTVTSKFAPSHHIKDLSPAIKTKWSILVRLLKKQPILFNKSFCRLLFADLTGKIEAVAFREKIKEHNLDKLEEGRIYRISNGPLVNRTKPEYKAWKEVNSVNCDLHIDKTIEIQLVDERVEQRLCNTLANVRYTIEFNNNERSDSANTKNETTIRQPALNNESKRDSSNKVYPLDQISLLQDETKLNIIAIIESIGELEKMEARSNNSLQVRSISLTDTTNVSVVCRFYGKEAIKFNYKIGDILLIGKAVAKPFKKQIIICIYRETIINKLNQSSSLQAYQTLKEWWDEKQTGDKENRQSDYEPKPKKQKL
jgi:hypothetical protein